MSEEISKSTTKPVKLKILLRRSKNSYVLISPKQRLTIYLATLLKYPGQILRISFHNIYV